MSKRIILIATGVVALYAVFSLYRIVTTIAPDFSVFYDAARALWAGQNVYNLPSLYTGLGYPPFSLLFFLPFVGLPYRIAQGIWVIGSFLLFLLCIYLSMRVNEAKIRVYQYCLFFSLGFLAFPTKFTLGMGQINFAALTLLLVSLAAQQRKRSTVSGIALGLLLLLKPHFVLLLPVYLLVGAWISAVIGVLVTVGGALVSGLYFGWGHYISYLGSTVPPLLVFSGRDLYYNQGLASMLTRALPTPMAADLTLWASLLLVVVALWFIWRRRLGLTVAVWLFLPVFLLVEPLSWQHHYVFLLPVFVWVAKNILKNRVVLAMLVISYLLVAANIRNPAGWHTLPFSAILLSHVGIGNIILAGEMFFLVNKERKS